MSGLNDGGPLVVRGVGTVIIPAIIDGGVEDFDLTVVRHVTEMHFNLLSTTQLDIAGYYHSGGNGKKTFFDENGKVVLST